jgi:predicted ribosomally synthesized peptide with SipW-like signal peptide
VGPGSVAVLVGLIAVGAGTGATLAAFSDVTSNPSNTFSAAATFCASTGSQTVGATRDAWISQSSPAQNKGTDSALYVTSKSGNANERSLVYFSLPALPVGCSVTSATLRLYNESPVGGRSIQALRITAAWTENGVTWTNQPATTGTAAVSTYTEALLTLLNNPAEK